MTIEAGTEVSALVLIVNCRDVASLDARIT